MNQGLFIIDGTNSDDTVRKLTALRDKLARRQGRESFKILTRETIAALSAYKPKTLTELAKINGLGPKKIAQFGADILEVLNDTSGRDVPDNEDEARVKKTPLPVENIFTVSAFLDYVNDTFAQKEAVVKGEVSGFQLHPSGAYFSLKDKTADSILNCYLPPYLYRALGVVLEDGLEIKAGGVAQVYKPKGRLSFLVRTVELSGEGSLHKAYVTLKKKLETEGLFERKRPLPEYIQTVGIITSRTGAVINDFRRNLAPRGYKLFLYDVRVEGALSPAQIVGALRWFNCHRPELDILVVIRGGGSLEDLQAFNNEIVARELFASKIPTLCGIGHDRDVPIAALVADFAASTPTGAAVAVNASWDILRAKVPTLENLLRYALAQDVSSTRAKVAHIAGQLVGEISGLLARFGELGRCLRQSFTEALARRRRQVEAWEKYLAAVNPERNLKLGYGIVFNKQGRVVRRAGELSADQIVTTRLYRGTFTAKVETSKE